MIPRCKCVTLALCGFVPRTLGVWDCVPLIKALSQWTLVIPTVCVMDREHFRPALSDFICVNGHMGTGSFFPAWQTSSKSISDRRWQAKEASFVFPTDKTLAALYP